MVDTEDLPQRPDPHDGKEDQDVEPGPAYDPEAETKALMKLTKPELVELVLELREASGRDHAPAEAEMVGLPGLPADQDLDGIEMELERIADALERQNDLTTAALSLQEHRQGYAGFQDVRIRETAHDVIRGAG